jgi:hypothetical protein
MFQHRRVIPRVRTPGLTMERIRSRTPNRAQDAPIRVLLGEVIVSGVTWREGLPGVE